MNAPFWKRGLITASVLLMLLVFALWRDATAANVEDFDVVLFASGLLYGFLLVALWGSYMVDGFDTFLDWLDR